MDEQYVEGQRNLEKAVEESVRDVEGNGVVTAWFLIAHTTVFDEHGRALSTYPVRMLHNALPPHVVQGLLSVATDLMASYEMCMDEGDGIDED